MFGRAGLARSQQRGFNIIRIHRGFDRARVCRDGDLKASQTRGVVAFKQHPQSEFRGGRDACRRLLRIARLVTRVQRFSQLKDGDVCLALSAVDGPTGLLVVVQRGRRRAVAAGETVRRASESPRRRGLWIIADRQLNVAQEKVAVLAFVVDAPWAMLRQSVVWQRLQADRGDAVEIGLERHVVEVALRHVAADEHRAIFFNRQQRQIAGRGDGAQQRPVHDRLFRLPQPSIELLREVIATPLFQRAAVFVQPAKTDAKLSQRVLHAMLLFEPNRPARDLVAEARRLREHEHRRAVDVPLARPVNGPTAGLRVAVNGLLGGEAVLREVSGRASELQPLHLARRVARHDCGREFAEHEIAMRRSSRTFAR